MMCWKPLLPFKNTDHPNENLVLYPLVPHRQSGSSHSDCYPWVGLQRMVELQQAEAG